MLLQEDNVEPTISSDIWGENGIALLGQLVHFIDREFNIREMVLRATPMSTIAHSGANIADLTKQSCAAVGLGTYLKDDVGNVLTDTVPQYVFKSVTDGGSNMVKAMVDQEGGECTVHTIALVVGSMYKSNPWLEKLDKKLRGGATHFRTSNVAHTLLAEIQERHGLPRRKPPTKVETRWGGRYDQANWFTEQKKAVLIYNVERTERRLQCVDNPDGSIYNAHKLTEEEWTCVAQIKYLLEPFKEATDTLQSGKRVTGSLVLPVVSQLHKTTAPDEAMYDDNDNEVQMHPNILQARSAAHMDITKRWMEDMHISKVEDFALATALDPCFKNLDFEGLEMWMEGALTKASIREWLQGAWVDPVKGWIPRREEGNEGAASSQEVSAADAGPKRKRGLMNGLMSSNSPSARQPTSGTTHRPLVDQLDMYLNMPQQPFGQCDVLSWWREQRHILPDLARMARQYLAAPASSAGVERLFSRAGRYHDARKKCTTDENIESMLIAAVNTQLPK